MSQRQRCLMIGAGGHATGWIRELLPQFADRIEIAALVDVSDRALAESGDFLALPSSRRYREIDRAFEEVEADLCVVSIPAAFHRDAVLAAAEHGVPVLCEKPLADTWQACRAIYDGVRRSRVKMEVVQNYRYTPPMRAVKDVLRSGRLGRLNYVVARFLDDCRDYDSWARRHELPHAMLMDGAAHHLDMLRNLTEADCDQISALEWNPAWSSSTGEFCALCILRMTNGARATYEGNATAAGQQNAWHEESYRAECELGSVTVDADGIVRVHRHTRGSGLVSEEIAAPTGPREGHAWIVAEFLDWLDGGPTPATTLEDNIRSAAAIFGAIESSHTGQVISVSRMLEDL